MSLEDKLLDGGSQFTKYNGVSPSRNERTINGFLRNRGGEDSELHTTYSLNNKPTLNLRDPKYIQTPNSQLPGSSELDERSYEGYITHYHDGKKQDTRYSLKSPGVRTRAQHMDGFEF